MKSRIAAVALAVTLAGIARPAFAAGLGGSRASMTHQHAVAVGLDYTFARSTSQVSTLAEEGRLERVTPNADFALSGVTHPYARPEVRAFVEALAAEYRDATGTKLVVTSLVRPTNEQPKNASPLSVHPAGMAIDFRVPASAAQRAWLERTLLSLESANVLDVTRERRPSHYHVALFPDAYRAYAARHSSKLAPAPAAAPIALVRAAATPVTYSAPQSLDAVLVLLLLVPLSAAAAAHVRTPARSR